MDLPLEDNDDVSLPLPFDDTCQRETLVREIQFSEGFALIFAVCNRSALRQNQMAALRADYPELRIQEIDVGKPVPHLLYLLREVLESPPPDAVFVYGMENWISGEKDPRSVDFIVNLNAGRNHFAVDCPCPLVLWIPEYLHSMIQRGAPDFASIRSGYYSFASPPDDETLSQVLFPSSYLETDSTPNEREMRVEELTAMLKRLRSLPKDIQDKALEVRTLNRLINVLIINHKLAEAEQYAKQALHLTSLLDNKSKEVFEVYYSLARIALLGTEYKKAEKIIKDYFDIFAQVNTLPAFFAAVMHNTLGEIYIKQRRYTEAQPQLANALEILREMKRVNPELTSEILMVLSEYYFDQGFYAEATQNLQEALEVLKPLPNQGGGRRVSILSNLAITYEAMGRLDDAVIAYDDSLHELKKLMGENHPKVVKTEQYYLDLLHRIGK